MQSAPLTAEDTMNKVGSVGTSNLPMSLAYQEKATFALDGKRELLHFPPENPSTFTPSNNVIRINVLSPDRFIDLQESRLSFNLNATGTTPKHWLDGGAGCVIQTLRILSPQGEELERIESYNLLNAVLDQYEGAYHDIPRKNAMEGTISKFDYRLGADPYQNDFIMAGFQRHYELHLKGAWFNSKMQKLLLPGIQFTIELTLAAANTAMVQHSTLAAAAQTLNYSLTDVLFKAPVITIDDPAFRASVQRMTQQGYWWSGKSYRLYTNVVNAGQGDDVVPISDRSHSLEGLVMVARRQANVGAIGSFSLSTRSIQEFDQLQATIGTQVVPPQRIQWYSQGQDIVGGAIEKSLGRWVANADSGFAGATTLTAALGTAPVAAVNGAVRVPAEYRMTLSAAAHIGSPIVQGRRFRTGAAAWGLTAGATFIITRVTSNVEFFAYQEQELVLDLGVAAVAMNVGLFQFEMPEDTMLRQNELRDSTNAINVSQVYAEVKRVFPRPDLIMATKFQDSEANLGTGVMCLDLKTFKESAHLMSGKDTATNAVPINITLHKTAACNAPIQIDTFAVVDRTFMLSAAGSAPIGSMRSIV